MRDVSAHTMSASPSQSNPCTSTTATTTTTTTTTTVPPLRLNQTGLLKQLPPKGLSLHGLLPSDSTKSFSSQPLALNNSTPLQPGHAGFDSIKCPSFPSPSTNPVEQNGFNFSSTVSEQQQLQRQQTTLPQTPFTNSNASNSPWKPSVSPATSMAEPDYFATVHFPDRNSNTPGAVRIASPFALPTVGSTLHPPQPQQPHPWAALFGDGGIKTALPDASKFIIPPTPAANPNSAVIRSNTDAPLQLPSGFANNLNLSKARPLTLAGAINSLSLPPSKSLSFSSRSNSLGNLDRFKGLDIDNFVTALLPASQHGDNKRRVAQNVLVLDIRPSTSFLAARIVSSINVCAPSTLLKRPAITVERIEDEMLGSAKDKRQFMRWRKPPPRNNDIPSAADSETKSFPNTASSQAFTNPPAIDTIIVLDTDSCRVSDTGNPTAGGGGPCLIGMLKKFQVAGFAGELCWLVGGFNRLISSSKGDNLIETGPIDDHDDEDGADPVSIDTDPHSLHPPAQGPSLANIANLVSSTQPSAAESPNPTKQQGVLAMDSKPPAFGLNLKRPSLVQPRGLPMEAFQAQSTIAAWPGPTATDRLKSMGASQLDGNSAIPKNVDRRHLDPTESACANPFFDNIRQNRELAHGITEMIPMDVPDLSSEQVEALPKFLRDLVCMPSEDRANTLAQAFFDVEKAEQHRLIETMQKHSAESGLDPRHNRESKQTNQPGPIQRPHPLNGFLDKPSLNHDFPFSIAAALERGAENRYNNIWTYEHSRVKLSRPQSVNDPGSDYINASFVQPALQLGSKRRYIATQAPLPTTFEAFWTAIWQQSCRVIVMLTREHESGRLQSHPYWLQSEFGPHIRVDKLDETVLDQDGKPMTPEECNSILQQHSKGDVPSLFPDVKLPSSASAADENARSGTLTTIRRTFRLRNLAQPLAPPRKIVQLQYIAWPDYHIPETPDSLLNLVDMADVAQNEADIEIRQIAASSGQPVPTNEAIAGPMVVHCSAGVGRTGAFIIVDAMLDVIRRCRRRQQGQPLLAPWDNDVEPGRRNSCDIEMPPVTPTRTRSIRRSLKRELSPTGMDIDSIHDERNGYNRDVSSPPPMLRSRSNEGLHDSIIAFGGGTASAAPATIDVGAWSTNSSHVSTPSRAFGSLRITANPAPAFSNSINKTLTFGLTDEGQPLPQQPNVPSAVNNGANLEDISSQHTTGTLHHYRKTSSPLSEGLAPSLHSNSARSSFSSASVNEKLGRGSLYSSTSSDVVATNSSANSQSIESLNKMSEALNPFDAAMGTTANETANNTLSEATAFKADIISDKPMPFPCCEGDAPRPTCRHQQQEQTLTDLNPVDVEVAKVADTAYQCGEDLIRKAVNLAREQRMSLIQTGRQFVFVYSAVLFGILRELERDGTH